jgi:hypothetical protein
VLLCSWVAERVSRLLSSWCTQQHAQNAMNANQSHSQAATDSTPACVSDDPVPPERPDPLEKWNVDGHRADVARATATMEAACTSIMPSPCIESKKTPTCMNCLIPVSILFFDFHFCGLPLLGQARSLETQGAGQPSAAQEASVDFVQPWHSHRAPHRGTSRLFHSVNL